MSITFIRKFPDWNDSSFNMERYFSSFKTSNVVINASSSNIYYPSHHGPLTIKYTVKGDEYYVSNNCKYRVTSDNFLVLNEGQNYESFIDSKDITESISVFFKPGFAEDILRGMTNPDEKLLNYPEDDKTTGRVSFIEKLYPKDNIIVPVLREIHFAFLKNRIYTNYFYERLVLLVEGLIWTNRKLYKDVAKMHPVKNSTKLEIYKRLNSARDYIESCYNEKISLEDLSKAACMCEHHLLRQFKKHFKSTPYQYLISVRLQKAKTLLENTSKPIAEIANEIGFEFLSSFSELFFRRYGIPPSSFRMQQKSQFSVNS